MLKVNSIAQNNNVSFGSKLVQGKGLVEYLGKNKTLAPKIEEFAELIRKDGLETRVFEVDLFHFSGCKPQISLKALIDGHTYATFNLNINKHKPFENLESMHKTLTKLLLKIKA